MHKDSPRSQPIASDASTVNDLPLATLLSELKRRRPLIVFPPKQARFTLATKLLNVMESLSDTNSTEAWSDLLLFGYKTLHLDADSGDKVRQIRSNVSAFDSPLVLRAPRIRPAPTGHTDQSRAKAAERRIKTFADVTGAVRILTSDDSVVAPDTDGVFAQMLDKHPPASEEDDFSQVPAPSPDSPAPRCSSDDVLTHLKRFRKGTSGGLDGLTPLHLLSIIEFSPVLRPRLLRALAKICDSIISGSVPESVRDALFGAWLIALTKKSGGVRPIAIGSVFRRLAVKIALSKVRDRMSEYLQPLQMGFGSSSGAETVVHATRTYLNSNTDCTLVKVDFCNAFNSHWRTPMLLQVHEKAPELYNLVHYSYARPTPLFFGDRRISSESGCQQGDPAAPLLFSLVLHPLLRRLKSKLNVSYLDDLTLADPSPEVVANDLKTIQEATVSTGLKVNPTKCEVFCQGLPAGGARPIPECVAALLVRPTIHSVETLGSLGGAMFLPGIPPAIQGLTDSLSRMQSRLPLMGSHAAYYLLRHSLGIQRITHFLRTSPAFTAVEELANLDAILLRCAETCLNISLSPAAADQLRLPVSLGGLGLRDSASLALPCFLSSVHASQENVLKLLGPAALTAFKEEAIAQWRRAFADAQPKEEDAHKQWAWDKISRAKAQSLLIASNATDSIRLTHASKPQSGAWLHARPDANVGTAMSDSEFRIACGLRLGLDLLPPLTCACGEVADVKGYHSLSCSKNSRFRLARHNAVNDVVARALRQMGTPVQVEPQRLNSSDEIRPDGMTLTPWSRGRLMIWDVTVGNTFAVSYAATARTVGGVSAKAEREKILHYSPLADEYIIKPLAVETSGVWGKEALLLTREIGDSIKAQTGESRSTSFIRQRISIEVQRGNAHMIRGSLPGGPALDELFFLRG